MIEWIHDILHICGIILSLYLSKKAGIKPLVKIKINIHMNTASILNHLRKNWPHISASLGVLLGVAYNMYTSKTVTQTDVLIILGALGLITTTNSGTTLPPIPPAVKTIVVFVMLSCFAYQSSAQYIITAPIQMPGKRALSGDTVTNTGTAADSALLSYPIPSGSIVMTLKKISGTVTTTTILQGSVDGLNWTSFGQDTAKTTNSTGTFAFTWQLPGLPTKSGATGSSQVIMTPTICPFLYYRILCTGTGTMGAILKAWIAPR